MSQEEILLFIKILVGFGIVAIASNQIARIFIRLKLPLITGLLFVGIMSGPFVLGLVPLSARENLNFISDIALSYIAFAAGSELYLKELRDRFSSIKWITIGQLVVTFLLSATLIYLLQSYIPFVRDLTQSQKIIISILSGVVFIARSPASAIAIINEVRAKGPFTQTVLGVTVLKDFIVIIFFAVAMSFSIAIDQGEVVKFGGIMFVILEMFVSFLLGLGLARLLIWILKFQINPNFKKLLLILTGYSVYILFYVTRHQTNLYFGKEFLLEPLLICILGSFIVTNYSKMRYEFLKLVKEMGTPIYTVFFTLAGAVLALDVFATVWVATIIFFLIRLISVIAGAYIGGKLAGDPPLYNRVGWMPYVTQAGVGLGLALIVARTFPTWGFEFATVITSMIVINQITGPPLFKWALNIVKEARPKAATHHFDGIRDAIIFGLENQSIALARQLAENDWQVKIATFQKDVNPEDFPDCDIYIIEKIDMDNLDKLDAHLSEAVVLMLTDEENLRLAELIYEKVGTRDVIVRLNHRYNFQKFHDLGVLIVDPSTAIVSLLDHFVRSPQAASLLMGMQEGQDSMDIEVLNPNLHGLSLRNLQLPSDIILLSIVRSGQLIITHGYTRLRIGDVVTVVGSKESLQNLALRFDS